MHLHASTMVIKLALPAAHTINKVCMNLKFKHSNTKAIPGMISLRAPCLQNKTNCNFSDDDKSAPENALGYVPGFNTYIMNPQL